MGGFRGIRTWAAALAVTAALAAPAAAQEDPRQALAGEVVALMDLEGTIGELFDTMAPIMAASVGPELNLSASDQARLGEIMTEEFRAAGPEFSRQIAGIYAEHMSEAQLRDTVAFLRSPAGAAWVSTQDTAQQQLEMIGQEIGMRVALQSLVRLNQERSRR